MKIQNGTVVDGSGKAAYQADIAVKDDIIAEIGPHLDGVADKVINADGLVVSPGFIDIHSHTDATVFRNPLAESKIMQGITSDVTGNCGIGAFPVEMSQREAMERYLEMHEHTLPEEGCTWCNFSDYADRLDRLHLGPNLVPLVPHGALRIAAMGSDDREPTAAELGKMKELLVTALEQGAWGMSTGLIYPPGSFARTYELIALSQVLAQHNAIYTSHVRGESAALLTAVEEAIRIGRESGVRVEVSHLKAIGKPNWGHGTQALHQITAARHSGVDIAADQYPYTATSTGLTALVPQWAHAGGVQAMLGRLGDPDLQGRLLAAIGQEMDVRGGPDKVMITALGSERYRQFSGQTMAQIAAFWHCTAEEAVIRLLLEEKGAVSAVYFSLSDLDLEAIIADEHVSVGTDGYGLNAEKDAAESTHPRSYGTFARVLGLYTREKGLLQLETAVHKMTGLPAERLRLKDRGLIKVGMAADLTLFDPNTVSDRADFLHPHRYPAGIYYVIVNGCPVVAEGKLTGAGPGRVLRRNGK